MNHLPSFPNRTRRGGLLLCLLVALSGLALFLAQINIAYAATFTVTRFDDPAPNGCLAGDCSLREALIDANAAAGTDTVVLPAGNYTLTRAGTGEDAAATGDLDILNSVNILASGAGATIDAGGLDRVFHVLGTGGAPVVTMSKLTIRGGALSSIGEAGSGGGIYNDAGTLILSYTVVRENDVTPGYNTCGGGGGIYNDAGSVTLSFSSAVDNTSDSFGGGISSVEGVVVLSNASLQSNIAEVQGGGLYNIDGTVVITGSAVSLNEVGTLMQAPAIPVGYQASAANCAYFLGTDGGGIFSRSGDLTITNTLISGNYGSAGAHGAGIATRFSNNLSLENVAFLDNSSESSGGAIMVNGGVNVINNSLFQGNYSNGRGGAIFARDDEDLNPNTLTINNTDFISNVAEYLGVGVYGGNGGAIQAYSEAGTVTVEMNDANLIGNQALGIGLGEARGGAIYIDEYQPITSTILFTINNTTIDGNHADEDGGALWNRGGYVTINNSTLSHNSATGVSGGIFTYSTSRVVLNNSTLSGNTAEFWGAFYNAYTAGEMFLNNVTISSNSSPGEEIRAWIGAPIHFRSSIIDLNQTCAGDIVSHGYNIGPAAGCNFTATGDQDVDPELEPLADNGGPTETHALPATSLAIDEGNPAGCEADFDGDGVPEGIFFLDQRGEARVNIPGVGNEPPDNPCDVGAYEYQPLLFNGSFEIDANGNGIPDGWQGLNLAPDDGQFCDFAHGGLCSFYTNSAGPTKAVYQLFSQSGSAGDNYRLKLWAATRNATSSGPTGALVQLRYADGTKQWFTQGYNLGTHTWQSHTINFTAQKNYTSILVIPIFNNLTAGELLVDDVTLMLQP